MENSLLLTINNNYYQHLIINKRLLLGDWMESQASVVKCKHIISDLPTLM